MPQTANYERAALAGLLRSQLDVIARRQALACGMTDRLMQYRSREGGPWQRLLPGIYLATTGLPTAQQRLMAAQLYAGADGMITGLAVLAELGVRVPRTEIVDVLVPMGRQRRDTSFVRLHRTSRMPARVYPAGPLRYAPAARAVADAVRFLQDQREIRAVVASAVQRRVVPIGLIREELALGPVRGSAPLRRVLAEVTDGVRSIAEADLRDLIRRYRLPEPWYNPALYAGGDFIARPDAWWPAHGVAAEVDSREWHLLPEDWERTTARHALMTGCGIAVLHFPPRRLRTEPRQVAREIAAALRSGRKLPGIRAVPAAEAAACG